MAYVGELKIILILFNYINNYFYKVHEQVISFRNKYKDQFRRKWILFYYYTFY